MSKDPVMENEEFLIYWLTHVNSETVFEWLKEQKPNFQDHSDLKEIEKTLIDRQEPLINLGMTLHANLSAETARNLFRNSDRTIKKAIFAGPSVELALNHSLSFSLPECAGALYAEFEEIIDSFDEELLKSLLTNESIPDDLLVSLYERKMPFNSLADEQWLKAIAFTASNPRISTPLDKLPWDAPYFFSYCKVFTAGWKLFETLPVNKNSAAVLSRLGENLVPDKPHDMDVLATIKRWEVESDGENDGLINSYVECRYVLAKLIGGGAWPVKDQIKDIGTEFESLKDSDDLALRLSYYNRFCANKPEEVRELFEKDNNKFLDVAIYNTNLYINEDIRKELRQCCWDYEDPNALMIYPEGFEAQVERLTKEHPEWFPDFEADIPFDAVEDPLLIANKRLEFLQQQTKVLSQKLIGSEDQPSVIDDIKTAIDDVKSDLSESNQQLSEKLLKVINWGVWIAGVIIVFLLVLISQIS